MSARRRHASEQPPKAALSESLCAHWLGMTQNFFDSLTQRVTGSVTRCFYLPPGEGGKSPA